MYAHGFLKVAAACPSSRVGDTGYNVRAMIDLLKEAEARRPAIICFPEMCITGYSIGDLVFQRYLYEQSLTAIEYLLENNPFSGVMIFGSYIFDNDTVFNCSFVVQGKKILGIVPKSYLPHTNEFYEARWFQSGSDLTDKIKSITLFGAEIPFGKLIFSDEGGEVKFAAEVCADMWAPISPNETLYANGALIVFNSSASPAFIGKKERREILTQSISLKFNGAYVYVSNNASESTSEVVFSSHKLIAENGKIVAEDDEISLASSIIYGDIDVLKLHHLRRNNSYYKNVQKFTRDDSIRMVPFKLERGDDYVFEKPVETRPFVPKHERDYRDIINIQAAGVIKRLQYIGIERCVLGLSGGLDSTLALLSLCYAFDRYGYKREDIIAVTMPSKETGSFSLNNARDLAAALGVTFMEIPIALDVERSLNAIGHDGKIKDATYENVQARIRTHTLMNLANLRGALVIGTSDMSEMALGWSTFGGDHMAMYGLNAGLTKTAVIETVRYYKSVYPETAAILDLILSAPISPELTGVDQKTEELIGKYEINDFILYRFWVVGDDDERIVYLLKKFFNLTGHEALKYVKRFNKRFYSQQYKRLTAPEAVKILEISLSPRTEVRIAGDVYRE
jgi:NAD+ synthase (glutamine-hydrolysing)